jgi:transcriptional regulator with XRE-family HTH domain
MSQGELAIAINRSESWVSQVERGVYAVERIGLLQALADALGVSMAELRDDVAEPPAEVAPIEAGSDLDGLRLALSGHPALEVLLTTPDPVAVDVPAFEARVEHVWSLEHASEYTVLNDALPSLLHDLERASRTATDDEQADLLALLARAYQAAAASFAQRDEADASWVAADRAIAAADRSGKPLQAIAGHFRMAHAFMRLNQMAQAERVATVAADALASRIERAEAPTEELSLYGAMNLVLAFIRAKENDRVGAKEHLAAAQQVADRLGADRNDFNTEFGPTNVQLHALAVAIEIGDAGEALDIAARVDPSGLSPERQARFWLDVGRAHAQRRHIGDAVAAIREAEDLAPEQIRGHRTTRETVALLVQLSGRRILPELAELAQRTASDL